VALRRGIRWGAALLTLAVSALLLGGCGGGEPTLTASELVQRVNEEGVEMRLGKQLPAGGDADRLYAVHLPPLRGQVAASPASEAGPGASGSLYVFGDSGGARRQFDSCRDAAGLLCYRASNIVVVLDEDSGRLEAQRLAVAMGRLAR
jgi:hypothetical protein